MRKTESKLRQRTTGRLDRTRDPAILNAAVAALTENGYDATNMADIAARAGVGKAAIYRRWSSEAALITDALVCWKPDLLNDAPDTGSLVGDLDAVVERVGRNDNELVTSDLVLRVALEDLVCDVVLARHGFVRPCDDRARVAGDQLNEQIVAIGEVAVHAGPRLAVQRQKTRPPLSRSGWVR
jgi:AcrR family transcriptional regulator